MRGEFDLMKGGILNEPENDEARVKKIFLINYALLWQFTIKKCVEEAELD